MVSSSRSGASIRSSSDKSHYSADSFPQPAGQLVTPKTDNANANSNRPRVSFEDPTCKMNEAYLAAGLAEIQKNASNLNRAKSVDSSQGLRRPTATVRNHEDVENSRRNRSFFSDVFAYREPQTSARDRISRESVIIVELKTNVDIEDEKSTAACFSHHLSIRYQRPTTSIVLTLIHSACIFFRGSFDPAYVLTISALPSQVQAATNKRNTALMQDFLADLLDISPDQGVVRFTAIPEESLATNGITVLGAIESFGKSTAFDSRKTSSTESVPKRSSRRDKSPRILRSSEEPLLGKASGSSARSNSSGVPDLMTTNSEHYGGVHVPGGRESGGRATIEREMSTKLSKKKSIMGFFRK